MNAHNYAEQIRRTKCGAVDDYHYFRIGRRIRSEAFHAFMKRIWTGIAGETQTVKPVVTVGLRWEPKATCSA